MKYIYYIIISLIMIGAVFCFTVLLYGICKDMSFIEVIKEWFSNNGKKAVEEVVETLMIK